MKKDNSLQGLLYKNEGENGRRGEWDTERLRD